MSYEEYLNVIDQLAKNNINKELLKQLQSEKINPNFNDLLVPKFEELLKLKFQKAVSRIKSDLENIFKDENYLDLVLVNYRKEIEYLLELIKLPQIPSDRKVLLTYKVVEGTREVYDILLKEAREIDATGAILMMIENNRIRWSE